MPQFRVSVNRPLDLERFTDRVALGALFGFGAAGYLWGGWGEAVGAGVGAYLSWALARELDPDHSVTANVAALAGGTLSLALATDVGVLLVMLLTNKVLVGGSGLSPARWEAGLLGAAAMVFAGTQTGWWAAVAMAAALLLDTAAKPKAPAGHRYIALGTALGASAVYLLLSQVDSWWWMYLVAAGSAVLVATYSRFHLLLRLRTGLGVVAAPALGVAGTEATRSGIGEGTWWMYILLAVGLIWGVALIFGRPVVRSPTDHAHHPISSQRVALARCLTGGFAITAWAAASESGLTAAWEPVAPLWAVLILVGIVELSASRRREAADPAS